MSIADKLTYLDTTKQLLKTEINKINNVLTDQSTFRSYPQELFNGYLDILNNGTDTLWNNLEKVSQTGTEAVLEGVETAPMKMVLSGNTSQETSILPDGYQQVEYIESDGNQYIDTGYLPNQDTKVETEYEITYLGNSGNGFVFGSRISTNSNNISATFDGNRAFFGRGNNYAEVSTTTSLNTKYLLEYSKNNIIKNGITLTSETANDFTSTLPMYIFCCNQNGNTLRYSRMKLYSFKIYDNNTLARDFIPCYRKSDNVIGLYDLINGVFYTNLGTGNFTKGADAVLPNPDYPQEVKVVTGENVVSVQGKQLLDTSVYSLGSINGNTGQNEESSSVYRFDKYNEVNPNTTIYLLKHLCIYFYNENKGFISSNITGNLTITTPPNTKYIRFRIFGADFSTFNPNDYMVSYTQETHFVPYSKIDYPINLGDIELCKINTYKDFPFKAINGNEYYDTLTAEQKNALNYGSWYVHKEIGKKVPDGSENWYISGQAFKVVNFLPLASSSYEFDSIDKIAYCNYFQQQTPNSIYTSGTLGFGIQGYGKSLYVARTSSVSTVEQFKTWLSTHNTIVYYVLATPTEEEITNTTLIEQLEAISNAKSVKDKTYITQTNDDLPFILDVEAIKEYEVV